MLRYIAATMAAAALAVSAVPSAAHAQSSTRIVTPRNLIARLNEDPNAARIGIYLGENGMRDTLGVLVGSVVENGPAAKAGIKEGDRIQSIGRVNLMMTRDDASDQSLTGMMGRRMVRELDKRKAGDDVELRVYSGGSARTVTVKTVPSRELTSNTMTARSLTREACDDRAALGLSAGGRPSARDTLGVFVIGVTPGGPAEKAGIFEGDRIAKINGADLRVPAPDAGDAVLSRARSRRLNDEIAKLAPGDVVTLTVVSGGRQRDVKVTAAKASELGDRNGFSIYMNGDGVLQIPMIDRLEMPRIELRGLQNGGTYFFDNGRIRAEVREKVEKAMKEAQRAVEQARRNAVKPAVKKAVRNS